MQVIQEYTNARIGILGNPSDGYFGATIAATIQNFAAQVILYEWPQIEILPGPADADKFSSISDLVQQIQASGYYGGTRLIKGTIKKFWDYLRKNHISLADSKKNFSIRYESTIPRQVGLAGSSAIIISTLKALCEFYDITIPLPILPNIALSVEKEELGIQGGLQDRVAQVYGGLVYMDFRKDLLLERGYGEYERLDPSLLPPLYVAYQVWTPEGKSSEVLHNDIRQRYDAGDTLVIDTMEQIADCAREGRKVLVQRDYAALATLLDQNYALRASMYNIASQHKAMVALARSIGATAQFAGSGGAIVGTFQDEAMFAALQDAFREINCEVITPIIT